MLHTTSLFPVTLVLAVAGKTLTVLLAWQVAFWAVRAARDGTPVVRRVVAEAQKTLAQQVLSTSFGGLHDANILQHRNRQCCGI